MAFFTMVAVLGAVRTPAVRMTATSSLPSLSTATRSANAAATSLPLKIDGVWYDVQDWADEHPGGRWLLEYAKGRDVTARVRATHMLGEGAAAARLSALPVLMDDELTLPSRNGISPSELERERALQGTYVVELDPTHESPIPPIDTPLRKDLRAMMKRRFPNRESMKATPGHWVRTAVCLWACLSCWAGWLRFDPLCILLLPFAQWLLAAHTVHEATHGALSTNPTINYWAQFTGHPILFNVFVWIPQHLLSHHQYTNDPQHDVDVHHFAAARLSTAQPPYVPPSEGGFNEGWTFVWKGCLTTLGTCILQPLRTLLEKPTPNFDVNLTPIPAAVSKRTLLLSMLPSMFVMLYPITSLALGHVGGSAALLAQVWPWVGMSMIWTLMTQTSHVQAKTQPGTEQAAAEPDCWTARQIGTGLDYSAGSPLVTALTAGLNSQGLHHAMPAISMAHFPAMYREYEQICRKHGVTPRQSRDLGTATREMFEYVFELNEPAAARQGNS
jgi:fatty acid desaturase